MHKDPLHILLLEDSLDDVGLVERELRKQGMAFRSKTVDTKSDYIAALQSFRPDVILSDHSLPQFNSLEALNILQDAKRKIPFILVTGSMSEEFAVTCLKRGADDYVLKTNLVRLPSAIISAMRQKEMEVQRLDAEVALRRQNVELTKINRELDSFVYSVSHNLRAPLMSVLGLLNIVQVDKEARSRDDYFRLMESSIHKLDETLKEILEYSRNARSEIRISEIDIRQTIEDCLDRLMYMAGSDQLQTNIKIEGETRFFSDAYRINVIVSNLLSNAIKYRDPHKTVSHLDILISISDDVARIVVRDNGIGIDEALVPKIFDMFFRASDRSDGAGLGLYIVKETVEKLNGTIRVNTSLGDGTTFFIQVPNMRNG